MRRIPKVVRDSKARFACQTAGPLPVFLARRQPACVAASACYAGGAAAREKNGANNLEKHDRDNQISELIPQPNPNRPEEAPPGFGGERMQTISQETAKNFPGGP